MCPDVSLMMGGDAQLPCATATLGSIGGLGVAENKKISAELFPLIKKHLGVDKDRCYVLFHDKQGSDVGYMGGTFHK